jgi:hypothetical protein
MCPGDGCPRKSECYRYRAVPTPLTQSYFAHPPIAVDGSCEEFLELRPHDRLVGEKPQGA